MAYTKTSWSDGVTPVDASNMNKIEDALVDQDSRIDANTDLISGINIFSIGTNIPSNSDLDDYTDYGSYRVNNSSIASTIENTPRTSTGYSLWVIPIANGSSAKMQISFANTSGSDVIQFRVIQNGTWTVWRTVSASNS